MSGGHSSKEPPTPPAGGAILQLHAGEPLPTHHFRTGDFPPPHLHEGRQDRAEKHCQ